jgi:hypothetical protein
MTAQAQIPDPAAQRRAMEVELKNIHTELAAIRELLASGKLEVRVIEEDAKSSSAPRRR